MHAKYKGARNELRAVVWLLEQGYDVFRNVADHGIIDIVAKKGEEVLFLDVTARRYEKNNGKLKVYLSDEQIRNRVKALIWNNAGEFFIVNPIPIQREIFCGNCGVRLSFRRGRYCSRTCLNEYNRKEYNRKKRRRGFVRGD